MVTRAEWIKKRNGEPPRIFGRKEINVIGKRVNMAGNIGTVISVSDDKYQIATIKLDKFVSTAGVFAHIVRGMPDVISRDSFDYKPGDRNG